MAIWQDNDGILVDDVTGRSATTPASNRVISAEQLQSNAKTNLLTIGSSMTFSRTIWLSPNIFG